MVFAVGAVALVATAAAHAAAPDPRSLVLRQSDVRALHLPVDVFLTEAGYESNAQASSEEGGPARAELEKWDRVNGYDAVFERAKTERSQYRFESAVDTFRALKGAREAMRYLVAALGREPLKLVPRPTRGPIGDEAHAYVLNVTIENTKYEYALIFWRYKTAVAHLAMSGSAESVNLTDALRLARKQQARMKAAFAAAR